ncbi:ABC transporter permease [Janthinobacterium sp. LB3P118]|uniref:ABC transporter permease n=1 Tax=Janthinobacterium sp. LB3P118 TaxID=3424195 RepID=UPI003F263758
MALDETLSQHGFNRTMIISVENGASELYDDDARKVINSGPDVSDGPLALLSHDTLSKILAMPEIDSVMAISRSSWQLSTGNDSKAVVEVLNVPPVFMKEFNLGNSNDLLAGQYLPSNALARKLRLVDHSSAIVSIPDETIAMLPYQMRSSFDWSKARFSVFVRKQTLNLGYDTSFFENVIFTTGKQQKINVPGLFLLPKINVLVKFREGVNVQDGQMNLEKILKNISLKNPNMQVQVTPFSKYFEDEIGAEVVTSWAGRLRLGFFTVSITLVTLLMLVRYNSLRYEIALRRALGATVGYAIWLSIRSLIASIFIGMVLGSIVGSVVNFSVNSGSSMISPSNLLSLSAITALAILVIAASARVSAATNFSSTIRSKL